MSAMALVTFAQVIARYVFEAPLSWSEELARFLLMWLAMLSAAYAFKLRAHFALRFVVDACPAWLQKVVGIVTALVVAGFLTVFVVVSIKFVLGVEGHLAPALQIPMEIPYSSAIAGSSLMLYYVVKNAWSDFVTARRASHDSR
ncbi:MAG: TRAP transporter small permease [Gammaproteobacteria bacterium]